MDTFHESHDNGGGGRRSVLVVEDDRDLRDLLDDTLRIEGFQVHSVGDGLQALDALSTDPFDLAIVDLMLPGISGYEVCGEIRAQTDIPILIISGRTQMPEVLRGFQAGANDYLTKPFDLRELVARARAITEHSYTPSRRTLRRVFKLGDLVLDFRQRLATTRDKKVSLSPTESKLLGCLTATPGEVVPNEELLRRVWGWDFVDEKGYVKLYISYLRKKLEEYPERPRLLISERGVGYRLNMAPSAHSAD